MEQKYKNYKIKYKTCLSCHYSIYDNLECWYCKKDGHLYNCGGITGCCRNWKFSFRNQLKNIIRWWWLYLQDPVK